jgi:hypothetical protein
MYGPCHSLVKIGHKFLSHPLAFETPRKSVNAAGQRFFQHNFICSAGLSAFPDLAFVVSINSLVTTVE